eukprot:403333713
MKRSESQNTNHLQKPPRSKSIQSLLQKEKSKIKITKSQSQSMIGFSKVNQQNIQKNQTNTQKEGIEDVLEIALKNKLKSIHNKKKQLEDKMKKQFLESKNHNNNIEKIPQSQNLSFDSSKHSKSPKNNSNQQFLSFGTTKSKASNKNQKRSHSNLNTTEKQRYKMYVDSFKNEKYKLSKSQNKDEGRIKKLMKKIQEKKQNTTNDQYQRNFSPERFIMNRNPSNQSLILSLKLQTPSGQYLPQIMPMNYQNDYQIQNNLQNSNNLIMKERLQNTRNDSKDIENIINDNIDLQNNTSLSNYNMSVNFNFNGTNTFFEKYLQNNDDSKDQEIRKNNQHINKHKGQQQLIQSRSQAVIPTALKEIKHNKLFEQSENSLIVQNITNDQEDIEQIIEDLNHHNLQDNKMIKQDIDAEPDKIKIFTFYHERNDSIDSEGNRKNRLINKDNNFNDVDQQKDDMVSSYGYSDNSNDLEAQILD